MEIQLWEEILHPYELAVKELTLKFKYMIKEYHRQGIYCPLQEVNGRVKSVSSILEKAQKKKIPFEDIEQEVEDIAGIRLTCQFQEDILKMAEIIGERSDMELKRVKDYFTVPKPSGYRSYHLIEYYTVETIHGPKKLQVEIQIRTMAMDFWATIEHSLQYKYKDNIPEHVRSRLTGAADAILKLDDEMSSLRSEIIDAQNNSQIQANIVTEILNNIQNLYKVANKREVIKIQDEFYHIYASGNLEQLARFSRELDIIAEGYRAQSVRPSNF